MLDGRELFPIIPGTKKSEKENGFNLQFTARLRDRDQTRMP